MSHPFSKKIKNNRYVYIGSKCSKSGEPPKTLSCPTTRYALGESPLIGWKVNLAVEK